MTAAHAQDRQAGRPPRVAIIRGGEWNCTQAIPRVLEALKCLGLPADVLCWDRSGQGAAVETVDGVSIRRFRWAVAARSVVQFLLWPVWWAWILYRLARGRYTVVHAMDLNTLPAAVAGRWLLRYRLIYDCRDALGLVLANMPAPIPHLFTAMDRLLAARADGLLLSQGDLKACADYFGPTAARHVPVVQVLNVPAVDVPRQYRPPAGRPLRINVSGYISPVRGGHLLVDAFSGRDDIVLDVVGDLNYPDLEDRFRTMPNAVVHGRQAYGKALELMDQADVVWLHYDVSLRNVAIASANKMFEAMMFGKPYITSDGSWMAQVARRFSLGWSLPYGDVVGLRALADQLNARPELLAAAGENGRQAYLDHFTWQMQRDNLLQLYRLVLRSDPTPPVRACGPWQRFVGATALTD